jgi:DNA-binding CsgD family transcriptional regulator
MRILVDRPFHPRPSIDSLESLVRKLDPRLTRRQVQVCARALLGMTSVAVGLDLGIRVSTVVTLRRRAYSILHISSPNELFALCLAQVLHATADLATASPVSSVTARSKAVAPVCHSTAKVGMAD